MPPFKKIPQGQDFWKLKYLIIKYNLFDALDLHFQYGSQ